MSKREEITQKGDNNFALINSTISVSTAGDELQKLFQEGKLVEASSLFQRMMRSVSAQHPAYPHWRYDMRLEDGQTILSHVPNYPEAIERYPLKGNIKFQVPSKYIGINNVKELLQNAYGKQEEIELDVLSLKAWIGEHLIEDLVSSNVGQVKALLKPPPFPKPQPMKLYFKENHFSIDYLEIGVSRIEGQVITVDNKKQLNAKIYITIIFNLENNRSKFTMTINEMFKTDVEAHLLFNQFFLEASEGKQFALKMLREGNDLFVSQQWTFDEQLPDNLDKYVKLLSELYDMQKEYEVSFSLNEDMDGADLEKLFLLKLSAEGKARTGKYTGYKMVMDKKDSIQRILEIDKENPEGNNLSLHTHDKTISFLGAVITFKDYIVEFNNAKLADHDKLKKKLELMEDGESISIEFVPASKDSGNFSEKYVYK